MMPEAWGLERDVTMLNANKYQEIPGGLHGVMLEMPLECFSKFWKLEFLQTVKNSPKKIKTHQHLVAFDLERLPSISAAFGSGLI